MELSEKIKEIRTLKRLTQEDLANACCVTRSTISNWEAGRRKPDWESIIVIANVFDITIDELIEKKKRIKEKEETIVVENSNKKLSIMLPVINTLSLVLIITLLLLAFLPVYRSKQNEFIDSLIENIEGMSLQMESYNGTQLYYFEEINLENSNSRCYQLCNLLISNEQFSKYQYCLEKIFIFDIIIQHKNGDYRPKVNSANFQRIDDQNNVVYLLTENNLPFITTAGVYDIIIIFNNNSYYIGAYLK